MAENNTATPSVPATSPVSIPVLPLTEKQRTDLFRLDREAGTKKSATSAQPDSSILRSEEVPNFPGIRKHVSVAVEAKGKPIESRAEFLWVEFPRDLTLATLEEYLTMEGVKSPSAYVLEYFEGAIKTSRMNRRRTELKRTRLGKPEIDPAIEQKLKDLATMQSAAKPGSKKAKFIQATVDEIMESLKQSMLSLDDLEEDEETATN